MTDEAYILTGGNTASRVARVGPTVRKPVTLATPSVRALLEFLHESGYPASPQHFGIDEYGRQSLEFVPGVMGNAGPPLSLSDLRNVGALVRELHEITVRFPAPEGAMWDAQKGPDEHDLICHNDLAPWNLVRNGDRWVFIDWDNAGPGSRLWDVAYAALTFPPVEPKADIIEIVPKIGALVRGYGLSSEQCHALPAMMIRRARAMAEHLTNGAAKGVEPLVELHAAGHTHYWEGVAQFIEEHGETLQIFCAEFSFQAIPRAIYGASTVRRS